ncbi:MAG: nucleotidyl transferase AbiEii/AbiGii toxin family protein [Spirochaetaceae bacterium]|jgi:predicted nucleotidyltransferase component of viral defense system|nr:nucleotidyl transferase AbiEii/AbiGii toxin family protein [Spirochaetaceae bacterium]
MNKVANFTDEERSELFQATSTEYGLEPAIIEKDFWVCFMLDHLFHHSNYAKFLVFKGGTSLSKGYHLIDRFSEDIDIILDWRQLGYKTNEPYDKRSNSQQDNFSLEMANRTQKYLETVFVPELDKSLSDVLQQPYQILVDNTHSETVTFIYPSLFTDKSLLQEIKLEIGPLAAWTPNEPVAITPYAAEKYPAVFDSAVTIVPTVKAERTFWEKATILHREANRTNRQYPARYSRHYYDLYKMAKSYVKNTALSDRALLETVVKFKEKFYRQHWAAYNDVLQGNLKLVPGNHEAVKVFTADYQHMQNMLFGNIPSFNNILECLGSLEKEINSTVLEGIK